MGINAVIFDLDGTITTFNLDYKAVRSNVRIYLLNVGVPASLLNVNENIFEMFAKTQIFFRNHGKNTEFTNKVIKDALKIAEEYEIEAAKKTSIVPGAIDTLKILKKSGLKLGLCTLNSEKSTQYILKRFNLDQYFEVVTSREKVNQVKPDSEHLKSILEDLEVGPSETLVVGDSYVDMQAAKQIKSIAVGLTNGVSKKEKLIAYGANYLITSIIDLPILIEKINQNLPA